MSTLEKMPGHTRLYRRGATYYHRAAIPVDIADTYPKSEETFSLRTKDYSEALRLVKVKAVEVDERFEEHRRWLAVQSGPVTAESTPEQIQTVADAYYAYILDEDEQVRLDGFHELAGEWAEKTLPETPRQTFEEHKDDWSEFASGVKSDYARGRKDDFFQGEAEEVLTWDGIEIRLDPSSDSWRPLVRALQEAVIRASKAVSERDEGDVVPTPALPSPGPSRVLVKSSLPMFSVASQEFLEEGSRGGGTQKTRNDYGAWLRNFVEAVGDRHLDQYSKHDGRKFKAILATLPANRQKKKEYKALPIGKAAEKAVELGMEPMSLPNANKAINRVSAFFSWADANFFDGPGPEPLKGMSFKLQERLQDAVFSFSTDQLNKIFSAPLYTGFRSDRKWAEKGTRLDPASSRFWLPLIGLFSGAREGEIFALTVDDIYEEDGVVLFHFVVEEDEEKRVKTKSGIRRVAVHKILVDLGLLALIEGRKAAGEKDLFYDCAHKEPKRAADNFSKWFARYLVACETKTKKHVFHSFRHNMEDAYINSSSSPGVVNAMQGHAQPGMMGHYGMGQYKPKKLRKAISKVKYPGLDLSHIRGFPLG